MGLIGKWFGFSEDEIYEEGVRAFEDADFGEAIDAFDHCLTSAGDPAILRLSKHYLCEAYQFLGTEHLREGNFRAAADAFGQAIALSPNYPDLHLGLAKSYAGLGDIERQAREIYRALELHPTYVDALIAKGALLYQTGEHDLGLAALGAAVLFDLSLYSDVYRTGLSLHEAGRFDEALAHFQKLQVDVAKQANFHAKKGLTYLRSNLFDRAKEEFEKAIEIAPKYADLRLRYGQILYFMEDYAESARQFRTALSINSRYVEALSWLGKALAKLERPIEAGDCFARALVLDPYHLSSLEESAKLPARRSMR